jgi:hypothetical protein
MGYRTDLALNAGPGYGGTCWKSGSGGAANCAASAGAMATTLGGRGCVVQILWWGCFMCPFANAEFGLRYRVTPAAVRLGHPFS